MSKPKHAWMVRAGNNNELADLVYNKNAVAVGWAPMQDLSHLRTRNEFRQHYASCYPDHSPGRANVNAAQLHRLAREIQEGDYILTYLKANREMLIGLVDGPYEYRTDLFPDYPHVRRVKWLKRVPRDNFSAPARNSMGSTLTVFNLDEHLPEIHRAVSAETTPEPVDETKDEAPPFFEEVKARADELIADLISRLDPYDFQDLVAAVLRAMGFRAVSGPPGPDRGVDIVAHPDPFGFERPRIKVQVKHRQGNPVSGPEMRSFIGTLRADDCGLFVSTSGFTRDAMLEVERSREPITPLDRDGFIDLFLEHYEALDSQYKAKVPLRKVWVPAE
ncbi:MAG: restriction endonuclease [Anaerolineales bacterium]